MLVDELDKFSRPVLAAPNFDKAFQSRETCLLRLNKHNSKITVKYRGEGVDDETKLIVSREVKYTSHLQQGLDIPQLLEQVKLGLAEEWLNLGMPTLLPNSKLWRQ